MTLQELYNKFPNLLENLTNSAATPQNSFEDEADAKIFQPKDLVEEICRRSVGKDVEDAINQLKEMGKLRFFDEKIQNGCDEDEEDDYVMSRSYDLKTSEGYRYIIWLYYGNNTYELFYYDLRSDNPKMNEGWKDNLKAAAVGATMALSPTQALAQIATAQNTPSQRIEQQTQQKDSMSVEQLQKCFPKAYEDRKKSSDYWKEHKNEYAYQYINKDSNKPKTNLVALIAASNGTNPWLTVVKRYAPSQYHKQLNEIDDSIFNFSDFDI